MVSGDGNAHSACGRAAAGRVPGDVNIVTERAGSISVGGDHWLVIEMVRPAGKRKERNRGISFAAVSGARYCHLTTVHAVAVTKEDYDVAVKQVAESIEYHGGIGTKAVTVGAGGSRQRQIHSTPTAAAIRGK